MTFTINTTDYLREALLLGSTCAILGLIAKVIRAWRRAQTWAQAARNRYTRQSILFIIKYILVQIVIVLQKLFYFDCIFMLEVWRRFGVTRLPLIWKAFMVYTIPPYVWIGIARTIRGLRWRRMLKSTFLVFRRIYRKHHIKIIMLLYAAAPLLAHLTIFTVTYQSGVAHDLLIMVCHRPQLELLHLSLL